MGIMFAFLSALTFSANYIFIQLGMKRSKKDNGEFLSLISLVITVSISYFFILIFDRESHEALTYGAFFYFALAGFLTAFIGRILLFSGIRRIGSSRAAALKNTAPVFTVILAVMFLNERISFWGGIGIAVIFLALFLQARHDFLTSSLPSVKSGKNDGSVDQSIHQQSLKLGLLFSFVAAMFFGLGQVARKQGMVYSDDPVLGSLIGSSVALFFFLLMKAVNGRLMETLKYNVRNINPYFIAAGSLTGIAQICFFTSLHYTNVSYTSVVAATEPIITVLLGNLFLKRDEKITPRLSTTAITIFLGTFIIILGR